MSRTARHFGSHQAFAWLLLGVTAQALATLGGGCGRQSPRRRQQPSRAPQDAAARGSVQQAQGLEVSALRVLASGTERPARQVSRGESVEIRAIVTGMTAVGRRMRLLASWQLTDPRGRIIARQEEPKDAEQDVPPQGSTEVVQTSLGVTIPKAATPGSYTVGLRYRDGFSGARAAAEVTLHVAGPDDQALSGLRVLNLRPAPDVDVKAGLPMVVDFELAGLTAQKKGTPNDASWAIKAEGTVVLLDAANRTLLRATKTLLDDSSPVPPASWPLRWLVDLPSTLAPGAYRLRMTVRDLLGGQSTEVAHDFRLLPAGVGLYAVRLSGGGAVARNTFTRGEPVTVDALASGLTSPTDLELDVGLVGPDGGFYLVRKSAAHLRAEGADPSRALPVRLTLQIPEFAPAGSWRLKLRLRAPTLGQEGARELGFSVAGPALEPWPSLRVQGLVVRRAQSEVPLRFLRAGETYHLDFVVGGMRLVGEAGYYHRAKVTCTLRLRDRSGRAVASQERACHLDRRFSFAPLRLRLAARWTLPREAVGLHRLEVEVLDHQSDRVSSLQRNVFVLMPR